MLRVYKVFVGQATVPYIVLAADIIDAVNALKVHDKIKSSIEIVEIKENARIGFVSENVKQTWGKEND